MSWCCSSSWARSDNRTFRANTASTSGRGSPACGMRSPMKASWPERTATSLPSHAKACSGSTVSCRDSSARNTRTSGIPSSLAPAPLTHENIQDASAPEPPPFPTRCGLSSRWRRHAEGPNHCTGRYPAPLPIAARARQRHDVDPGTPFWRQGSCCVRSRRFRSEGRTTGVSCWCRRTRVVRWRWAQSG